VSRSSRRDVICAASPQYKGWASSLPAVLRGSRSSGFLQHPRLCDRSGLVFERCALTPKTWGEARLSRLHIVRTLMPLTRTASGPASPFTGSGTSSHGLDVGVIPQTANHNFKTARWLASVERSPLGQPCALTPSPPSRGARRPRAGHILVAGRGHGNGRSNQYFARAPARQCPT
jgi:hypothetical protein